MTRLTWYQINLVLLTIAILTVMPNNKLYANDAMSQQSEKILTNVNKKPLNETQPLKSPVNLMQMIKSPLIDNESSGKALKKSLQIIKNKLEILKHKDNFQNEVEAIISRDTTLNSQTVSGN